MYVAEGQCRWVEVETMSRNERDSEAYGRNGRREEESLGLWSVYCIPVPAVRLYP